MTHTFLLSPGIWLSRGMLYDANNQPMDIEGRSEIVHQSDLWIHTSQMEVLSNMGASARNVYHIRPFAEGKVITMWDSENAALGDFEGRFMLVADSIISQFQTSGGEFSGVEYFKKISDGQYQSRGMVFEHGKLLSSWASDLERQ